jgi:cation:H+ antiporter
VIEALIVVVCLATPVLGQRARRPVGPADVWLGCAGLLMTGIVGAAVIARPKRTFLRVGIDSIALVVIYAAVIALLPKVT